MRVVGNFYGEKQGPKIWNDQLNSILLQMGFERCKVHPCLYRKISADGLQIITVHVDDGLMFSNKPELHEEFITEFLTHVRKATVQKEFHRYIGMNVKFNPETSHVELSHSAYITDKFSDFTKKVFTPMSNTTNLRIAEPNDNNESLLPTTGTLRFIADRARPDIMVVTGELANGGAHSPSDEHVKTAVRVKNYLSTTATLSLKLGGTGDIKLFGYSDASYNTVGNCKSRLGGCVFLGFDSGAIHSFRFTGLTFFHGIRKSKLLTSLCVK